MGYKRSVLRSLAMVTQLGLCVITPILFCVFAGSCIDSRYGTKTTLVLLIFGTLGGGRGAYMMAKRLIDQEAKTQEAEQARLLKEALKRQEPSIARPKLRSHVRTEKNGKRADIAADHVRDDDITPGIKVDGEAGR